MTVGEHLSTTLPAWSRRGYPEKAHAGALAASAPGSVIDAIRAGAAALRRACRFNAGGPQRGLGREPVEANHPPRQHHVVPRDSDVTACDFAVLYQMTG